MVPQIARNQNLTKVGLTLLLFILSRLIPLHLGITLIQSLILTFFCLFPVMALWAITLSPTEKGFAWRFNYRRFATLVVSLGLTTLVACLLYTFF